MRNLLLSVILSCVVTQIIAQELSAEENAKAHRRYWYYRTRFINDFIKLGKEQGESIVFSERNFNLTPDGNILSGNVGPDQIDLTNMYLATLALEYKLLTRANQNTQETIKEIYQLLWTLNRLDLEAEHLWSNQNSYTLQANGTLNGFMLREDYPNSFIPSNKLHYNYSMREFNSTDSLSYTGLGHINNLSNGNKFKTYVITPSTLNKQNCSLVHDKYYSMFGAFMLLVKYIPPGTVYFENGNPQAFQDGEIDIREEVKNITNRIHPYLKGNTFANIPSNDWIIKQPDGSDIGFLNGSGATAFSFTSMRMICHINNGYPWQWTNICTAYSDPIAATIGFASYNTLNDLILPGTDQAVFLAWGQAGSNYPDPNIILPGVPTPCNIDMILNTASHDIRWAELLRRVLFQTGFLYPAKEHFANPINIAPCNGPYNFGDLTQVTPNCLYPNFEWSSHDRTEHPNYKGNGCNANPGDLGAFSGNYPGVDYMLLHNLYYEYLNQEDDGPGPAESGAYKNAVNLMDNYDEQTWPLQIIINPGGGGGGLGKNYTIGVDANINTIINPPGPGGPVLTVKQPARIKLFQNLESRAQIYASASPAAPNNTISSKVEYRAGKEISLMPEIGGQPGFEVKLGSDFTAYIQRYICSGNSDPLQMKQNPNNENNRNNDYENDDMNTEVPIHYVQGPKSDSDLYPYGNENEETYSTENTTDVQNALVEQYNIANDNNNQNQITSLENIAAKQRFIALPNPNNGVFKVYANRIADNEVFELSVYDMKGQMILNYKNLKDNVSLEIDLSNNSEGIYMLHLNSSLGGKLIKKVTVIK